MRIPTLAFVVCFSWVAGAMATTQPSESKLATAVSAPSSSERAIIVVGDSLSAAYGLKPEEGWVALLAERLSQEGENIRVVNAAISGDTTRGGKARLPLLLDRMPPGIVIIELGGNDGLRGIAPGESRRNLTTMVETAKSHGYQVLLVGMRLPPNLGPAFTAAFEKIFIDISAEQAVPLVPFLLDGVALNPQLMQRDAVHPTAQGQPRMLDNVWPELAPLL